MSCEGCGGTAFVEDDNHNVCQSCGNINETVNLVGDHTPLMSTFMKYDLPVESMAFRRFKDLYQSCTRTLHTPRNIENEGLLMLPKMWNFIRHKRQTSKRLFLIAMLYLLYRQHHAPVVFGQFLKAGHVPRERLSCVVQLVMKQFNLPMYKSMNIKEITSSSISELVKLVFKNSTKQMETDTFKLAQKLSEIIYKKGWGETSSKNYISLVSVVSTLLSAQYVCSNLTNRKTKDGRKSSFRFMTINYQKMADHMCVHVMAVKKCLKVVQRKLFQVSEKLPWTAACIKKSIHVAQMLVDLLDNIDIEPEEEEIDFEPPIIQSGVKSILIKTIQSYISIHSEIMRQHRPLIDTEKFKLILNKQWLQENDDSKENMPVYHKDEFIIQESIIKYHHLELYKDLLLSGCSVDELLKENYINLVEKYVDMPDVEDEESMEEFTDREMSMYFKDPHLVSIGVGECSHHDDLKREEVVVETDPIQHEITSTEIKKEVI